MPEPAPQSEISDNSLLDTVLDAGAFATCVKDRNRRVLMQNPGCLDICGDKQGDICDLGCMELLSDDNAGQWDDWGSRVYKNSFVHGAFYDVTLLCSDRHIVSFLQPLKDKHDLAMDYYQEKGLTARESEIIALTIQGVSNSAILGRLSISKATLRTHLNKIYSKLRDLGEEPRFIPGHRGGA